MVEQSNTLTINTHNATTVTSQPSASLPTLRRWFIVQTSRNYRTPGGVIECLPGYPFTLLYCYDNFYLLLWTWTTFTRLTLWMSLVNRLPPSTFRPSTLYPYTLLAPTTGYLIDFYLLYNTNAWYPLINSTSRSVHNTHFRLSLYFVKLFIWCIYLPPRAFRNGKN